MKIGIDARHLSRPLTGIGKYIFKMILYLSCMKSIEIILYSPAPILDAYKSKFNKHIMMNTSDYRHPIFRQLWGEFILPRWIKRDKLDIFWAPAHRLPFFKTCNTPTVLTIYDLVFKYYPKTMRFVTRMIDTLYMGRSIKKANHIVVCSDSTRNDVMKEFDVLPHEITTVYNGVDKSIGKDIDRPLNLPLVLKKIKKYILFVGTLEPRKNLINLLTAYAALDACLKKDVNLVIVGGKGWGNINLHQIIQNLNIQDNVHLMGYITDEDLHAIYKHALFLAMPSLYEGFGIPIVEAMSYGLPVLTSNSSSMAEVTGGGAFLINPLDISSIKKGLEQLIKDHSLRNDLSLKGLKNIDRFQWDESAKKIYTVFESLIQKKIAK